MLGRYEDYWGEKAYLDNLVFRPIREEHLRIQALIKEEIEGAQLEDVAGIKSGAKFADRLKLREVSHLEVVYLALNMRKGPLNRLKVREAVYRAINKEKLQEMFYPGKATVARGLIPPTLWGYNPDLSEYDFDPGRAKELLKEAKVEELTLSLLIPDSPVSYLPNPEGIADQIKDDLAGVGIDVEIIKMDWRSYLEAGEKGEHHMALTGWRADFPDPDNFLYPLLDPQVLGKSGNTNWSFYQSSFFHEILERARRVTDEIERARLYQVAQKIVQQDIPCVPLVHTKGMIAFSPEVEGVSISSAGIVEFEKVWIKK
ncbi:Periplasmic dipeptide transport protein [subsurface metagenome]